MQMHMEMQHYQDQNPVSMMVDLCSRLAQIMAQEVRHLREMEVHQIERLMPEKTKLIHKLEHVSQLLQDDPSWRDGLSDEEREELREVGEVFKQVMLENLRHLKLACEVNEGVMQAIREALATQHQQVGLYNGQGKDVQPNQPKTLSMTINDTV